MTGTYLDACEGEEDHYDAFLDEKYWMIEQLRKKHCPETPKELFNDDHAYHRLVDDEAEKWRLYYWGDDQDEVIEAPRQSDIRYPNNGGGYTKVQPGQMFLSRGDDAVSFYGEKSLVRRISFINPDLDVPYNDHPYIAFHYLLVGDVIGEGKFITTFHGGYSHEDEGVPDTAWTGLGISDGTEEGGSQLDAIAPWRHRAMAVFKQDVEKVLTAKIRIGKNVDQEIATLLYMDKQHPGEKFATMYDGSVWLWRKD